MRLPVLTGRFGSPENNGPGLAFFRADADEKSGLSKDELRILLTWRPDPNKPYQWFSREVSCKLENAWEMARTFPLEVIATGPASPSSIVMSYRSTSAPETIRYHLFRIDLDDNNLTSDRNSNDESVCSGKEIDKDKWDIDKFDEAMRASRS